MIGTAKLAARLARRHLDLYAGAMVIVALTTLLGASEASLAAAMADPSRVTLPGVSADRAPVALMQLGMILKICAGLSIVISGFLMVSTVRQVVSYRQRELVLMRLAGAGRRRLGWLVFLECAIMAFVIAVPAALMGALLAPWLLDGLKAVGFFGPGVAVRVGFQPMSLLAVVVSMVLVAALAGRSASRQITRQGLIGVSSETVARMSWRSVAGRAVVGVGGVVAIILLDPQTVGSYGMLALPFLAVVPAMALAPLVVPAGAWGIGRLVGWFAPGPGLLAARRSSKDRVRFARLATPVLVAVGTLGGFMVANVPDEQVQAASFTGYVQAQTVLTTVGAADADRVVEAVSGGPLARVASVNRVNGSAISSLTFAGAADMGAVTSQKTTSGDVAKVGGGNVAVSTGEGVVGDTITVPDANGRPVVLRVVATVNDPLYDGGILLGWDQINRFAREPGKLDVTIYAKGVTASVPQREVRTAGVEAQVYDRNAYVGRLIDNRKAGSMSGNVGIFGTVYLMCLVSVVQMAVSGGMSRRREFGILRSLGAGAHGIVRTVATECVIIHVVAGVLIGVSVGALAQEFATANGTSTLSAIRQVVPLTAAAFIVVTLLALLAHTASTRITVDRIIRGAN